MAPYRIEAHENPGAVLAIASGFLRARPVECNAVLTVLHDRSDDPQPGRYWIAHGSRAVAGVAVLTPPDALLIVTPAPAPVVDALAGAVLTDTPGLRGVLAEALTAAAFAGAWTEHARAAVYPREGGRTYRLLDLRHPEGIPGFLRPADHDDRELVRTWARAFAAESGNDYGQAEVTVDQRLTRGRVFVWDDDGAVSMASATVPVAGVSRIAHVYTAPDTRRRGYAGACVAALSQWALDDGADTCILFTQLHNPTSNGVYRAIGYEAISELLVYEFQNT